MKSPTEIKDRILEELEMGFRRPGMVASQEYMSEYYMQLLSLLAFIDSKEEELESERKRIIDKKISHPPNLVNGVLNCLRVLLPEVNRFEQEIGSVYAEIAWRMGYLCLDRLLTHWQYEKLRNDTSKDEWFEKHHTAKSLFKKYGMPSFTCGLSRIRMSENAPFGSFCYVVDKESPWIILDCPVKMPDRSTSPLRNVRIVETSQEDGLKLTLYGRTITSKGHFKRWIPGPEWYEKHKPRIQLVDDGLHDCDE